MSDMILEMSEFPVRRLRFGDHFEYQAGTLEMDRAALIQLVLEDQRIETVEFDIAYPDDPVRITGVRDVVEPRIKPDGGSQVFPGAVGPVTSVGEGRTHRLAGMAVIATAAYEGTVRAGTAVQRSALIDMWGPGAAASRFSSLVNLVLIMRVREGLAEFEAHSAIQRAEIEVAKKLAQTTAGLSAESIVSYDLRTQTTDVPRSRADPGMHHPAGPIPLRGELLRHADPGIAGDGDASQRAVGRRHHRQYDAGHRLLSHDLGLAEPSLGSRAVSVTLLRQA